MDLSRSQFLHLCAAGLGALALAPLTGCDDSGGTGPTDGPPADAGKDAGTDAATDGPPGDAPMGSCAAGTQVTIGSNHGHTLVVPAADIAAGTMKTYDITGASDHPHTVVVTAAMFAMLQQNMQVAVVSSIDDGHPHTVTIKCA